jgi:hypothetical protein
VTPINKLHYNQKLPTCSIHITACGNGLVWLLSTLHKYSLGINPLFPMSPSVCPKLPCDLVTRWSIRILIALMRVRFVFSLSQRNTKLTDGYLRPGYTVHNTTRCLTIFIIQQQFFNLVTGCNNRTKILPVVLYGCETWSLTLREERTLRVLENRVLRRVFGSKRDEVTGE